MKITLNISNPDYIYGTCPVCIKETKYHVQVITGGSVCIFWCDTCGGEFPLCLSGATDDGGYGIDDSDFLQIEGDAFDDFHLRPCMERVASDDPEEKLLRVSALRITHLEQKWLLSDSDEDFEEKMEDLCNLDAQDAEFDEIEGTHYYIGKELRDDERYNTQTESGGPILHFKGVCDTCGKTHIGNFFKYQ
jgi:hypothetical protein